MTRDAEMKARDFVALVAAGVHAETEVGVVQRLLLQAQTALSSYADPEWACRAGLAAFADRLLELARDAEPGSDHQLALSTRCARRRCRCGTRRRAGRRCWTTDPAELGPPGLIVDTDLRWRHRHRAGRGGDIDETAPRRRSSTPRRSGTPPRRASATPPRRRRRGRRPPSRRRPGSRSSRTTRSPTSPPARSSPGSFNPARRRCWRRSRAKYFDAIAGVWERRSSEVAQTVVIGLYPSWDVSQAGLEAADRFLAGDVPPALHRLVLEGRAGVERALRARAFDIS